MTIFPMNRTKTLIKTMAPNWWTDMLERCVWSFVYSRSECCCRAIKMLIWQQGDMCPVTSRGKHSCFPLNLWMIILKHRMTAFLIIVKMMRATCAILYSYGANADSLKKNRKEAYHLRRDGCVMTIDGHYDWWTVDVQWALRKVSLHKEKVVKLKSS